MLSLSTWIIITIIIITIIIIFFKQQENFIHRFKKKIDYLQIQEYEY